MADTVLSISKIFAGITAKSECKKRIYDRILERCIPVKIDGVSRREAMENDNMQTMKNILKIYDYFKRNFHSNGQRVSREEVETSPWRKEN